MGFHIATKEAYARTDYICQKDINIIANKKVLTAYLRLLSTGQIQIQWAYHSKGTENILSTHAATLEPQKSYSADELESLVCKGVTEVINHVDLHCPFRKLYLERISHSI